MEKARTKGPFFQSPLSCRPADRPISKRKTVKNPLKISVVNGRIPSACLSLVIMPMSRLPMSRNTLPLVKACLMMLENEERL